MRPYPQNWQRTTNEWLYFNDEHINAISSKRNFFSGIHIRSLEDLGDGDIHMEQIGRKARVYNMRNGIEKRSEGDKNYRRVELSSDFHKFGSTLPAVNFGRLKKRYGHEKTYVPMKNDIIPIVDENDFEKKELQREHNELVNEVIQLEQWKPAESITSAFKVFDTDPNDKTLVKYRPRFR